MRLNTQSDYALRLLMHLAINGKNRITISEVAKRFCVSRNHLMKVTHLLVQLGFVQSTRGRKGGLALAKSANQITVGAVIRGMENDFALVECFQGRSDACLISPSCRLKSIFQEAMAEFLVVLDGYTIEDLVGQNPGLRRILVEGVA